MKIAELKCTCSACPTKYEIKLEDGRMAYLRYRWGCLSINISLEPTGNIMKAVGGKEVFYAELGDEYDGYLSHEEVVSNLKEAGFKL